MQLLLPLTELMSYWELPELMMELIELMMELKSSQGQ